MVCSRLPSQTRSFKRQLIQPGILTEASGFRSIYASNHLSSCGRLWYHVSYHVVSLRILAYIDYIDGPFSPTQLRRGFESSEEVTGWLIKRLNPFSFSGLTSGLSQMDHQHQI